MKTLAVLGVLWWLFHKSSSSSPPSDNSNLGPTYAPPPPAPGDWQPPRYDLTCIDDCGTGPWKAAGLP